MTVYSLVIMFKIISILAQLTNELGPQSEKQTPLYKQVLNLHKSVNNILRQIMTEFVVGFPYNSYEIISKEFNGIGSKFDSAALDALKPLIQHYCENQMNNLKQLYEQACMSKLTSSIYQKNQEFCLNFCKLHDLLLKEKCVLSIH
uniref:Secreted protein n=1 Tax=Meloidogyne hapla TaxID=6305 RepID=A0A1I8BQV8_MELHA